MSQSNNGPSLALGISLGLSFGTAIGLALGNLAIGISMGIAIGTALGVTGIFGGQSDDQTEGAPSAADSDEATDGPNNQ
ncbi:MAG: hypothetical protein Aurels2KO_12270 [Aureliella sp.]